MQEKILLMPAADGTELVRSLAARGVCCAGLTVTDGAGLARIGLTNSGKTVKGRLIDTRQQTAIAAQMLAEENSGLDYFKPAAYADAKLLSAALDKLRMTADDDTLHRVLPKGLFSEKNKAVLAALDEYERILAENGLTDRVSVMRQALAECSELDRDKYTLSQVAEYPLAPLERQLLEKLSGGRAEKLTIAELYGCGEGEPRAVSLTEAYGASNEAEDIINTVFTEKLPLDRCVVAVTDSAKYTQLFAEICGRYDIPFTLGCGTLMTGTLPAKLLSLIPVWAVSGSFGTDGLYGMIFSEAFDRKKLRTVCFGEAEDAGSRLKAGIEMAGNMRLGWDAELNAKRIKAYRDTLDPNSKDRDTIREIKALDAAEKISAEMQKGAAYIIENYAAVRKNAMGRFDSAAKHKLTEQLKDLSDGEVNEVIPQLLSGYVCPENSRSGALHITTIEKAYCTMRDEMFIAGLSADNFPGMPHEDHLVLDDDCRLFPEGDLPLSTEITMRRKDILRSLLCLADAMGCRTRLSCYDYELSEMKDENRSSALEELRDTLGITESRHTGFFDAPLSPEAAAGKEYIKGVLPKGKPAEPLKDVPITDLRGFKKYSPSDIGIFFQCPKHFLLSVILGLDPCESDDPLTVITARDFGKLLHKLMEISAVDPSMTMQELLDLGGAMFDNYLLKRPPLDANAAVREKAEFMRCAENALIMQQGNEVISAENKYTVPYEDMGITLTGLPDRVEICPDGSGLIADFKTGRVLKHTDDDIDSCLQTVIYAYMMEKNGVSVSGCEYRYVRLNKVVSCRYDEDMKQRLYEKLSVFAKALENSEFGCTDNSDDCRYCPHSGICGREEEQA
ncbi:PD-(D/E)XK nuclease family protein [uncultured Ruminococcus sp.]|uniref:PD-(D/E)XK nuclease family protein n=1 Tax=uncultured Ruminococcus sp. TaxID=165186 RepID=UPI0025FD3F46|nr:PD-(D/E)XK nuclease family protein [uncultured Ruminococcus sp.]